MSNNKNKQISSVDSSFNRRDFLRYSSSVLAASGLGLMGRFSQAESEEVYDFIVVGSGAGGAPVATRLAERGFSVLVLEAGQDHGDNIKITTPSYHGISSEDYRWSWNFFVRHHKDKLGQPGLDRFDSKFEADRGGILYPRVSAVGGCTIHNAMITMYPDNKDWADIAALTGDQSWNSTNMRSYFRKLEDNRYMFASSPKRVRTHGYPGFQNEKSWLQTTQTPLRFLFDNPLFSRARGDSAFRSIIAASAKAWGLQNVPHLLKTQKTNLDANSFEHGPKDEGIYRTVNAIYKGQRSGPRRWMLETEKSTNKFRIQKGALATKLIFKETRTGESKKILGVEAMVNSYNNLYKASPNYLASSTVNASKKVFFKARKEVILAGGAFNTPQLLMLSGIGETNELDQQGIETQVHLPGVGKNLQDRYEIGVVSELNNDFASLKDCTFQPANDPCLEEYKKDKKNHVYSTNGVVIGHMVRSRVCAKDQDPDLFVFAVPGDFRGYYSGYSSDLTKTKNKLTWAVLKAHTSNTNGTVSLKSNSPHETPNINFNNFSDGEDDLLAMVDGVNFAKKVNSKSPLRKITREQIWPKKEHEQSEETLKDFIAKEAWGHHASCTSKMGPRPDKGDVVNSNFQVHGVSNLRVVDASVFPKIPGHFIVTPIYMIAEKAADVITQAHS